MHCDLTRLAWSLFPQVCAGCCGLPAGVPMACVSVDCPVLWSRTGAERQAEAVTHLREVLQLL